MKITEYFFQMGGSDGFFRSITKYKEDEEPGRVEMVGDGVG